MFVEEDTAVDSGQGTSSYYQRKPGTHITASDPKTASMSHDVPVDFLGIIYIIVRGQCHR